MLNAAFAMAILDLISRVHLPSFVNKLPKYLKHSTFSSCYIETIQASLKSNKNDGYFTLRPIHIFDHISLVLLRMRHVSDKKLYGKSKHPIFVNTYFPANRAVHEIMRKNLVQPHRPQMTTWLMRLRCWITKATNTHFEYVTHSFATATMVTRTTLNVMLYVHLLSCFSIQSTVTFTGQLHRLRTSLNH